MPLMRASSDGRSDIFKALLKNNANVNRRTKAGLTALTSASLAGHTEFVRTLLDMGADVNAGMKEKVSTALAGAAHNGHADTVKVLLERGAAIDVQRQDGNAPLMIAAGMGADCLSNCRYVEIVRLLLAKGAQVRLRNAKHETALMRASCSTYENGDIVKALLDKGSDANAKKPNGESVLICAAERGNRESVKILLAHGADPNARTKDGMTAIKKAVQGRSRQADEIVKMLKDAGARE
jgi:ankyrin repeat protein